MLAGSSRARSIEPGAGAGAGARSIERNLDKPLGSRQQARGRSGLLLARRRFKGEGGGRTRAGRQEMSAAPVFSNFEAFHITTPNIIILLKLACLSVWSAPKSCTYNIGWETKSQS